MGVYKLGAKFLYKLKEGRGASKSTKLLPIVKHYFLDVNGILHNIAQKTFGYKGGVIKGKTEKKEREEHMKRVELIDNTPWEDLMIDYESFLFDNLDYLMSVVKPRTTICLCVDGVAPAAKIFQQRSRRIGGSSNESRAYPLETEAKANTGFSSTFITPGTQFMDMVDVLLQKWLNKNKNNFPYINHIYSSYNIDGEGEHKIFSIIDSLNIGKKGDIFAIDGLDSDLVSLAILRPQHYILVKSERREFTDVDELKEYVYEKTNAREKGFSLDLTLKDFVLIMYIVGNDFLPRFLFVEDVGLAINKMLDHHADYVMTPITTSNDSIDWFSFSTFLDSIVKLEERYLMDRSNMPYAFEHPILHSDEARSLAKDDKTTSYMNLIKEKWRDFTLLPKNDRAKELILKGKYRPKMIQDELNIMCNDMCKGLLWVLKYYNGNNFSKNYTYDRYYAPLITDLTSYINKHHRDINFVIDSDIERKSGEKTFNAVSQLMAVIPEKYNDLIPEPFNKEVLKGGKFHHLSPVGFPVKREGLLEKGDFFMEKVYLPLVNIQSIVDYVEDNRSLFPNITPGKLIRI